MIIEFSVGNFCSIKDMETLSMLASPKVSVNKELDVKNVHRVSDKLTLLKSKAIYGANASGKSSMVKAMAAFKRIVSDSFKNESVLSFALEPFRLSTETADSPTFFQLQFVLRGIQYRYGFEAKENVIHSEWLFGTPRNKEVKFFSREMKSVSVNSNQFSEADQVLKIFKGSTKNEIARDNALFLSATKAIVDGLAKEISDFISAISVIVPESDTEDSDFFGSFIDKFHNKTVKLRALTLLHSADVAIKDLAVEEFEIGKSKISYLASVKQVFDSQHKSIGSETFHFELEESEGTKRMLEVGSEIIECLRSGRPLIIDEFDARFHPELTKRLVELMNSHANKKGQVVFVTHDTNLLDSDLLRRDQICLVEKDKYGASHFYTLADFKGVRSDAQFEKDYLSGRYGAIPLLGDFEALLED
jgi:uncharacterized protein